MERMEYDGTDKTKVIGQNFNDPSIVLLIKKTHPDWQKGLLNGIGGKCEEDESSINCAIRELKEESGLTLHARDLRYVSTMKDEKLSWEVTVFTGIYNPKMGNIESLTEEQVGWYVVNGLGDTVIHNRGTTAKEFVTHITPNLFRGFLFSPLASIKSPEKAT